ncbi:hypothetical protein D3C84_836360 [compost metagenome]
MAAVVPVELLAQIEISNASDFLSRVLQYGVLDLPYSACARLRHDAFYDSPDVLCLAVHNIIHDVDPNLCASAGMEPVNRSAEDGLRIRQRCTADARLCTHHIRRIDAVSCL